MRSIFRHTFVLFLAVCGLGISAFITQVTLMRELLSVFSGNELVFGIVLGNWLLLTGAGSSLGRTASRLRHPIALLVLAQIAVALLPVADVFLLRVLRDLVFLRGAEVGVTGTVASVFVLLAPYCLVTGYLLTLACLVLVPGRSAEGSGPPNAPSDQGASRGSAGLPDDVCSKEEAGSIGQVYFLDNIGDVVGGIVFSVALVSLFNHFGILYFPALVNLALAGLVAVASRRWRLAATAVVAAAGFIGVIVAWDLEEISTRAQYAGQHVEFHGHSPYGRLVVTRLADQVNFFFNGLLLFATHNIEQVEETVHYAMAQRPDARRVLLISGGVSGTAREVLQYGVETVDYVEIDPLILEAASKLAPHSLDDPRIRVVNTDGRRYVQQTQNRYDVVLCDVADPSTSQINRFYTREFFTEVERILAPGGVLSLSLGHYENYLSDELSELIAVTHRTLRDVFRNVEILPAGEVFFLASGGPLAANADQIASRLESAGIATQFVRRHYLKGTLTTDRLAEIRRAIDLDGPRNRDFSPILYYCHLRYWLSQFEFRYRLLVGVLLGATVVYLVRIRPVPLAIFTTGFAASTLEVVLLVAFQVLYGSVYHRVGWIVTMFMLGLGIGSFIMNRMLPWRNRRNLAALELLLAAYAIVLPAALVGLGWLGGTGVAPGIVEAVIPLLALLLAVLVGLEFPLAAKVDFRAVTSTAARLYTADYVGAALGALLVSTFLIPLLGVVAVCWLAAGLNLLSGGVILVTGGSSER